MTKFEQLILENTQVQHTYLYHASRVPVTNSYLQSRDHVVWCTKNRSQAQAYEFYKKQYGVTGTWSINKFSLKPGTKIFDSTQLEKYIQLSRKSGFDDLEDEFYQYQDFLIEDPRSTEVLHHDFTKFLLSHGYSGIQIEEGSFLSNFHQMSSDNQQTICIFDTTKLQVIS